MGASPVSHFPSVTHATCALVPCSENEETYEPDSYSDVTTVTIRRTDFLCTATPKNYN